MKKEKTEGQKAAKIMPLPTDRRDREKIMKLVEDAVKVIQAGGVVVLPTETAYCLAVDATNEAALKRVLELKKNTDEQWGLGICVSDARMAAEYVQVTKEAEFLMRSFMPGPLTLISKNKALPKIIAKEGKIAFRISSNNIARLVSQESGKPITVTGAHAIGEPSVYKIDEVKKNFADKVDAIVDAGNLFPVIPSTVIEVSDGHPKVLREGPLASKEILSQLEMLKRGEE